MAEYFGAISYKVLAYRGVDTLRDVESKHGNELESGGR